jgi:hypothetical protein
MYNGMKALHCINFNCDVCGSMMNAKLDLRVTMDVPEDLEFGEPEATVQRVIVKGYCRKCEISIEKPLSRKLWKQG